MANDECRPSRKSYSKGDIQGLEPFYVGQLLTAADLNELIDAIKELDLRLRDLER